MNWFGSECYSSELCQLIKSHSCTHRAPIRFKLNDNTEFEITLCPCKSKGHRDGHFMTFKNLTDNTEHTVEGRTLKCLSDAVETYLSGLTLKHGSMSLSSSGTSFGKRRRAKSSKGISKKQLLKDKNFLKN